MRGTGMLWASMIGVSVMGEVKAQDVQKKPAMALVELFTSEGCSSCPPADALLEKLDRRVTGSGVLILGLSEHVTYWNRLGWADPFSQELFTQRQNGYGERFHLDSVYTPQMVVNGQQEVLGSDGPAVLRAVGRAVAGAAGVQIETAGLSGGKVAFTYTLTGPAAGADVYAVIAEDRVSSAVLRGENAGRRLTHTAVARSMVKLGGYAAGRQAATVASPPAAAGQAQTKRHLVVFVQEQGMGRILTVDSKPL